MNDSGWALLDPWFLAFAPAVWLVWLWRGRRDRAALSTASLAWFAGLPRSPRARLVWLPTAFAVLGVTALSLALARPVAREVLPLRERGVDILLVIDLSSSMNVPDMEEGSQMRRVEAARAQALEFARGRATDRVGLLTYALYPELRCPLTLDERALAAFLTPVETVEPGSPEDKTAIGVALADAVRVLEQSDAASRVVVLLTDGENNVDEITPSDAAKLAADANVRVHTIGLGRGRPFREPFSGELRFMPADFSMMQQVADTTGGKFFRALDAEGLAAVYGEIDRMEKVELEDPRYRTSEEFAWPLVVGIGLLALSLLLEVLWIRGAP